MAEEKIISTLAFWLLVQPAQACQHGNDTGSHVWLNSNSGQQVCCTWTASLLHVDTQL